MQLGYNSLICMQQHLRTGSKVPFYFAALMLLFSVIYKATDSFLAHSFYLFFESYQFITCRALEVFYLSEEMCGYRCGCFLSYPIATPATAWLLLGLKPPVSCA